MVRKDIQLYRAIAVLSVIIYHFKEELLPFGYLGVDLFFVISGYLISKQILELIDKNNFKLSNFYFRRFKRIFPSLVTSSIFTLILGFYNLSLEHYYELIRGIKYSFLFIGNIFFSQTIDYFTIDSKRNLIINLWSLSVEEQFYLVFPIFLIVTSKLFKYRYQLFLVCFLLSLWGLSEVFYIRLSLSNIFFTYENYLFYSPFSRAFQFLAGSIGASISSKHLLSKFSKFNLFFIIILVFNFYFDLGPYNKFVVTFVAFFLMINEFKLSNGKLNNLLVHLGNISFSLYLFHQPILAAIRNHIFYANLDQESIFNLNKVAFLTAILIFIYLISLFNYLLVEQTYRKARFFSFFNFKIVLVAFIFILGFTIFPKNTSTLFNKTGFNIEALDQSYETKPGTNYLVNQKKQTCIDQDSIDTICKFGSGKKDLYILGDSMTSSMVNGFFDDEILNVYTIYEYTKSGCYPAINRCEFIPGTTYYEDITSLSNTNILIGGDFDNGFVQITEKDLIETINLLISNNNQIILIGYIPSPKIDELMYYRKNSALIVSENLIHFEEEYKNNLEFEKVVKNLGFSKNPKFQYLNIFDSLCKSKKCNYLENGNYFFTDGSHLSYYGAKAAIERSSIKNILLND